MKLPNYAKVLPVDTFTFIIPHFHIKVAFTFSSPLNTPSGTKTVGGVSKRELPVPLLAEPQQLASNLLAWYYTCSAFFVLNSSLAIKESSLSSTMSLIDDNSPFSY